MERRVLLAITLSFLVLFLFQRFVMPPPAPLPAARPAGNVRRGKPRAHGAAGSRAALQRHVPGTQRTRGTRRPGTATPAGPATTVSEAARARDRRRDDEGQGGLLESRRDDRALDPEGVPQRRGAAARSRARRRRRRRGQAVHAHRRRSGDDRAAQRCDLSRHRERRARRPTTVDATASPQTIVFESRGRRRLHRQEDVRRRADELHHRRSAPSCRSGGSGSTRSSTGARALATTSRARRRRRSSRRATTRRRSRSSTGRHRSSASRRRASGSQEGPFRYAGVDDHYFVVDAAERAEPAAGARRLSRRSTCRRPTTRPSSATTSRTRCGSRRRRISRGSSSARRPSTSCARSIPS